MYKIVEFENEEVAVVHEAWLTPNKNNSYWPSCSDRLTYVKALRKRIDVDPNSWNSYPISRIFYATDDVDKALQKVGRAEQSSNLETEPEEERTKRKRTKKFYDSDSEDDLRTSSQTFNRLKRPPPIKPLIKSGPCLSYRIPSEPIIRQEALQASPSARSLCNIDESITKEPSSSLIVGNRNVTENSNGLEKIFREVRKLREGVKEIKVLLKQSRDTSTSNLPNNIPVNFPLNTLEDFRTLETYLQEEENCTVVASYLSSLGGNGITGHVNRILRFLMTNLLATEFNFAGQRNNKVAFGNTTLRGIIIRAILIKAPTTTQNEIENVIKIWLKHSRQRMLKKQN